MVCRNYVVAYIFAYNSIPCEKNESTSILIDSFFIMNLQLLGLPNNWRCGSISQDAFFFISQIELHGMDTGTTPTLISKSGIIIDNTHQRPFFVFLLYRWVLFCPHVVLVVTIHFNF
jgi:hypothetical protein